MMKNLGTGIIEGFFGPEWSWSDRDAVCDFLSAHKADFYIYAPKRDPYLRKNWTQEHPAEMWENLKTLRAKCLAKKIKFGMGLSPFEIHTHWDDNAKNLLRDKILKLAELDFDLLGLFFDDMKGSADLAEKQCEIVEFVKSITSKTLLFCPTYYSDDPILDKVFGARPEGYLEKLGSNIAKGVHILWTGNKVISKTISAEELDRVAETLKRKPLIWDNYFANDGPKQCKFLRLKPFEGRNRQAYEASAGWCFNLMNQAQLSIIAFLASADVLERDMAPSQAFQYALRSLGGEDFAETVNQHAKLLLEAGLDNMDEFSKAKLRKSLDPQNKFAREILEWLDGKYIVGAECLTD